MNYSKRQLTNINKNKELFKVGSKFNHYDVNLSESEEHDKEIRDQYFYLRRNDYFVAVRQELRTGGRPDIAFLTLIS